MMDRIAELRAMVAEATPGPWEVARPPHHAGMREVSGPALTCRGFTIATDVDAERAARIEADARLIAQAPTLATELAAALEREAKLRNLLKRIHTTDFSDLSPLRYNRLMVEIEREMVQP
jgi:hypothetical protein